MNQDKLVFVTGAGRGIGKAIAIGLAREGYRVAGCARSTDQLEETKNESKGRVTTCVVDVRNEDSLKEWFFQVLREECATPYALITAAGIYGAIGSFLENSWEKWKEGMDVNLYGSLLASRIFAKELIQRKASGRIILLSGGGATQPIPNFTSYCASKAAVVRAGETLAKELMPFNITVNSLAPGAVNTKLNDQILDAGKESAGEEMYNRALKQKESGGANPDRATQLCKYLLSPEANCISGKLLSAIWDSWENLHTDPILSEQPDLFTLRRITPEHLGKK